MLARLGSVSRKKVGSAPKSPLAALFSRLAALNRRASRLVEAYEDLADEFRVLLPSVSVGGQAGLTTKNVRSDSQVDTRDARRRMVIAKIHMAEIHDGSFAATLDHYDPIPVRGIQADLLLALSQDMGQRFDENDPLVGYKTAAMLLDILNGRRAKSVTRRGLVMGISRLRRLLARWFPDGGSLIHTRRGVGWRLALIRPDPYSRERR